MVLIGSGLLTFRTTSVVSSSRIKWSYYQHTLRNISEEHRTKLHCGRSPKSHKPEIRPHCLLLHCSQFLVSYDHSRSHTKQSVLQTVQLKTTHKCRSTSELLHIMAVLLEAKTAAAGPVSLLHIQPQVGIHGILCSKYLAL